MKTESKITENEPLGLMAVKSRFFAQYFGQKVLHIRNSPIPFNLQSMANTDVSKLDYLGLKPLSKITDEDAGTIPYRNSSDNVIGYYTAKSLNKNIDYIGFYTNEEIDNLRLLGYAVPFMEYSVNDLVSFGWVQLL